MDRPYVIFTSRSRQSILVQDFISVQLVIFATMVIWNPKWLTDQVSLLVLRVIMLKGLKVGKVATKNIDTTKKCFQHLR